MNHIMPEPPHITNRADTFNHTSNRFAEAVRPLLNEAETMLAEIGSSPSWERSIRKTPPVLADCILRTFQEMEKVDDEVLGWMYMALVPIPLLGSFLTSLAGLEPEYRDKILVSITMLILIPAFALQSGRVVLSRHIWLSVRDIVENLASTLTLAQDAAAKSTKQRPPSFVQELSAVKSSEAALEALKERIATHALKVSPEFHLLTERVQNLLWRTERLFKNP